MKSLLTEIKKVRILGLAKNGGFSSRGIAYRVFGIGIQEESLEALAIRHCIRAYLKRSGVKLRDWRNCDSILSKHHAKTVLESINESRKARRWRRKTA